MTFDPVAMQRLWRQTADKDLVTYNSITVTVQQPSVTLIYYTLPPAFSIPPTLSYPYSQIQNFVYNFPNNITPSTTNFSFTSNSIQLQQILHRIYVSVSKSYNSKTFQDTDSFIPIRSVNTTFGNQSGILSTLTQQDLYLMCLKKGLRQSCQMFSGQPILTFNAPIDSPGTAQPFRTFTGLSAPLCFEFGPDIPLLPEDFPGKTGTT
jgi:hypothetical protein